MVTYKKNINEKKFHVKFKLVYKKVINGKYIICYANDKKANILH